MCYFINRLNLFSISCEMERDENDGCGTVQKMETVRYKFIYIYICSYVRIKQALQNSFHVRTPNIE